MIIDVSHHQGSIDWDAVKASGQVDGVIVRAGYGKLQHQVDRYFLANIQGCVAEGLPYGVYWYSYAVTVEEAIQEAAACLYWLSQIPAPAWPVFFDQEDPCTKGLDPDLLADIALAFLQRIEAAGFLPGYYSYTYYKSNRKRILGCYPIFWQADYRSQPELDSRCYLHQYTSKGSVPGIQGRVDCNDLKKTFPQLPKPHPLPAPAELEQRVQRLEALMAAIIKAVEEVIQHDH